MRKLIYVFIGLFLLVGCASIKNLKKVSIGMTKDEIVRTLGEPTLIRGVVTNKYNQVIDIWEYKMSRGVGKHRQNFWFYFFENKLAQWEAASRRSIGKIYEIDFDPKPETNQ